MSSQHVARKKVYLGSLLQGQIISRLAMYWALYHIVLWHGMFFLQYIHHLVGVIGGGPSRVPFVELYGNFVWQHSTVVVAAAVMGPVILWDMIRVTHRVAGPLVRLENTLKQLSAGQQVRAIKFRKNDLVGGLEQAFNEFLAVYNSRIDGKTVEPASAAAEAPASSTQVAAKAASSEVRAFSRILHDLRDINESLDPIRERSRPTKQANS